MKEILRQQKVGARNLREYTCDWYSDVPIPNLVWILATLPWAFLSVSRQMVSSYLKYSTNAICQSLSLLNIQYGHVIPFLLLVFRSEYIFR
jgi:hypothetical protein